MLERNIQYRAVIYGALYEPAFLLTRAHATHFFETLAERAFPKLNLQYNPAEEDKPFSMVMKEDGAGKRRDTVSLNVFQGLLRVLVDQAWPDSFDVACRKAGEVVDALSESVPELESRRRALIEVRLRAQVPVPIKRSTSVSFLAQSLMGNRGAKLESLGSVSLIGFRYEVSPATGSISGPLDCPGRVVAIEPLRQEQGFLYLEVMSNWGSRAIRPSSESAGEVELVPGPLGMDSVIPGPSEYLHEAKRYTEEVVCPFLEKEK